MLKAFQQKNPSRRMNVTLNLIQGLRFKGIPDQVRDDISSLFELHDNVVEGLRARFSPQGDSNLGR